ncbi:MAG: phenylalanine--tRNA ligase subunit beta [Acidimicrobiia bacterium]|nr:phenylalanine--tRNA ligase subunit beta [Acidimicrobiia bacterium]
MRAPLSWIRDFTPLTGTTGEIADALNQLGLEVEEIDEPGRDVRGVVVCRILDVVAHPDADKIRLADVDFGDGTTRVVCGAANIHAGMVAPLARIGATLPGGFEIERRKIRGVVSEGMLCSPRELGLGDDHAGILALPDDAPLGTDVREVLGLDDVVFDLAITPDRPDAMGIVGIARDLAAHFGLPFDAPTPEESAAAESIDGATVVVEAPDRCPRLVARIARVRLAASPDWMQRRLTLAGMRPISNVVDVTNYVMLERSRPLHAFDLDRMAGRGIVVRTARDGERMVTLDGVERSLTSEDLLICDAERTPRAIAGIMGGASAEVSGETREIILESAHFAPHGIARTSKRLGLRSEASARFERGVDPDGAGSGADLAMRLLAEVAGADVVAGRIDAYPEPVAEGGQGADPAGQRRPRDRSGFGASELAAAATGHGGGAGSRRRRGVRVGVGPDLPARHRA